MNKLALVVVVAAACGKKSGGSEDKAAAKPVDFSKCPIGKDATERFAIGTTPSYGVPSMLSDHGIHCTDQLKPNDVLVMQGDTPTLVKEGTFTGTCKESPSVRTYVAVKPAKVGIEVNGLAGSVGELGLDKPVMLDSQTPDKMVALKAVLLDKCGDYLAGATPPTTWSPAADCEKVAKLVPWGEDATAKTYTAMQIAAVGPGTCKIDVSLAGATGSVSVTVK